MELIPLIYMKNRKIRTEKEGDPVSLDEILKHTDKYKKIYILDIDGIEKDKPNLCTYQRMIQHYEIWVDAGPRVLGDIVDFVMAGATSVTIRKKLFPMEEIPNIKEITESMVYTDVDRGDEKERDMMFSLLPGIDGLVIFCDKKQIDEDFKFGELLRTLCNRYKVYAAESEEKNTMYWKNMGVTGIFIDLGRAKQVNI